jgi:ABC-type nitrate/sulfonate/bicarbonate transport system substrate-binding protein
MRSTITRTRFTSVAATIALGTFAACAGPESATAPRRLSPSHDVAVAASMDTVRIGVFFKSVVQLAAQAKGFYTAQNLVVRELQVASSTQQFASLRDGAYDAVFSSPDNVVNYRLNDHNPLGARVAAQAIFGMDHGQGLGLYTRVGLTSYEDLRGRTLAVDALTSGYAYVAYQLLADHGLQRGVDYKVITFGGTLNRYNGLMANKFDVTLLNSGYDIRAMNAGSTRLGTVADVAWPYLAQVAAAKDSWLQSHADVAVRLTRGYYNALQWAQDPANHGELVAMLTALPNTSTALAEQMIAEQIASDQGLILDASIDRKGMYNMLLLRDRFGGFEQQQNLRLLDTPASGLFDLQYYQAAVLGSHADILPADTLNAAGTHAPFNADDAAWDAAHANDVEEMLN